nr:glycosyltransferase family 2 protein [Schumannella luteola]
MSVLLPVRDGARTVGAAVRSTLRAMPRDSELLVLDDASADGTASIVDGIADARIRLVRAETSFGVARGLNHLLELADSDYVARMDADDLVLPGRFARQLRALRRHRAELLFSTVVEFSERPRRVRPPAPLTITPEAFGLHLLLTNPVSHPTLLATRAVLDDLGGYAAVPAEDYELWLRAAAAGRRLARDAAPVLAYRMHPSQITASTDWRRSSWRDAATAAAFAAVAQRELGRPARRLTALAIDPAVDDAAFDAEVGGFSTDIVRAATRLDRMRSAWLRRLLAQRVRAARAARRSARAEAGRGGTDD